MRHLAPFKSTRAVSTVGLAVLLGCAAAGAVAQSTEHAPGRPYFGPGEKFTEASGAEVYTNICQGCHMPEGKGAVGAGKYPALAANANLASKSYIVHTILYGRKAMPPFRDALSDAQVAEVVTYLRSHFGNAYSDPATPAEVKAARPPATAATGSGN